MDTFRKQRSIILSGLALLFCANVLVWLTVFDLNRPAILEVNFFDVGQGEAIFIEMPQGQQILIDAGRDSAILEKLGKEMPFWDRTIDLVVLTHPEHDHLGGLIEVLKYYQVKNVFLTGVNKKTAENQEWQKQLEKENARIIIVSKGRKAVSGKAALEVIYPFEPLAKSFSVDSSDEKYEDTNNSSIVSRLSFGKTSFLFTGDISKAVERELAGESNIDVDVLKISHHGSKNSSAEEFIRAVSPIAAIISAGKDNPYGHPHPETLETLKKFGIRVLRTDIDGDIKIITNGVNYEPKLND